ncbi:hypothetical protein DP939_00565 [Spongiactinospora rosea]|uniref:Uncharacterized protein n=1 Tax=Spongiactinospora rosea TaxID=2248750 RepID=A0A366M4S8_9ACTN|nr:hypothetical protein DP939_00565 [Spongiactinospora rosea]
MPIMALSLRPSTGHASPSSTCWKNAPRWVRRSAGRRQSRNANSVSSAAAATPTSSRRDTDSLRPDSSVRNTATPTTNAGTPPKSAPHDGHPSANTASRPYAPHTTSARRRLPRVTRGCASPASSMIVAVANTANAMFPNP